MGPGFRSDLLTKKERAAYDKQYNIKHKDRKNAWARNYYKKNRKKILAKLRKRRSTPKGKRKAKEGQLRYHYGITLKEFNSLKKRQKNKCAVCRKKRKLGVDHCHKEWEVRGLVCQPCNLMLGASKDSPNILRQGAEYLETWENLAW